MSFHKNNYGYGYDKKYGCLKSNAKFGSLRIKFKL